MASLLEELIKRVQRPQPELEAKLGPVTPAMMPMFPLKGLGKLVQPTKASSPVAETLGERNPMFTPVGGESLYNVAKQGLGPTMSNPADASYLKLLLNGGK